MDSHRITGAAKKAKGTIKEGVGKVLGDSKLKAEGRADKLAGTAENAAGGVADAAREADRRAREKLSRKH